MNDVLTSRSTTPLMIPPVDIRMDKMEFRPSVHALGVEPYTVHALPNFLAKVFESKNVRITGAGFLYGKSGGFSTNGFILTRTELGLMSPRRDTFKSCG